MTDFRSYRPLACVLLGLVLLTGMPACTRAPNLWKDAKAGQKRILVTFPPLYSLTQAVAGDDAYVLCYLTTDGPHEYSFTQTDVIKAKNADLLIYNGLELDNRFADKVKATQKMPVLNVGAALPANMLLPLGDDDDEHGHEHGHEGHQHGAHDPHIWLGPPQAMAMVEIIGKQLAELDPAHADGYKQRVAQTREQLQKLLDEGRERFKAKKSKKVLTMHDSLGYFAKAFGLEVGGSIQPTPANNPDAVRLGKLIELCKKDHIHVITYEREGQESQPRLLEQRLKQGGLDVRLAEFDPLEVAPVAAGAVNPSPSFYFDKMRANIDHLAKALP